MKTCPMCRETKSKLDFHKNKARYDGLQGVCKLCNSKRVRERPYRKKQDSERNARKALLKYGETRTLLEIKESQENRCSICRKKESKLYIDHCHSSNKFRGLLCFNCNTGLGKFYDSIEFLTNAIDYLRCHEVK